MAVINTPDIYEPVDRDQNRGECKFERNHDILHQRDGGSQLVREGEGDDAEEQSPDRTVSDDL